MSEGSVNIREMRERVERIREELKHIQMPKEQMEIAVTSLDAIEHSIDSLEDEVSGDEIAEEMVDYEELLSQINNLMESTEEIIEKETDSND